MVSYQLEAFILGELGDPMLGDKKVLTSKSTNSLVNNPFTSFTPNVYVMFPGMSKDNTLKELKSRHRLCCTC